MKLVPKLATALLSGVFVVITVFTVWRIREEIRAFHQDVREQQRVIALTTAASLYKGRTREEAMRLAARVDATRQVIRVRFVSLSSNPAPALAPRVAAAGVRLMPTGVTQLVRRIGAAEADSLLTYMAAPVVDEPAGAIELAQVLPPRAAFISRGVDRALLSSAAMLLISGLIVAYIGASVVGQPVSELIAAARRIGAGEFDVFGPVHRKDEFGELARALRSMGRDLQSGRDRMEQEADARIRAIEQLRHAERLATLGQLASVLAHEIGTPLNVIGGHAKMIATGTLAGPLAAESAQTIGQQCDRMTAIVRRILDYARRRPGRRALVKASDILLQATELLSGLARQRDVALLLDTAPENIELWADPDQLQQAVTNLALNAVQASSPGQSVRLSVEVCMRPERPGDDSPFVVLTVEDTGVGVSPEIQQRIFEPFFTTKPPGEGTGLGLSVVRDIVVEHGGHLQVSSAPGRGARFSIHLPQRDLPGTEPMDQANR
ncbi:MAG TPA: HAMP domain-containing sensor histidine kinase [Polyangiaceae bacterium]|nr:HAMP domain-containing sensor histidine kinase [Polyangiaceae bacterium]